MGAKRATRKNGRPPVKIERFDRTSGHVPDETSERHCEGSGRVQPLTSPFAHGPNALIVHFQLGARTRPHVHRSGQILHVVSGEGVVSDGERRHIVRPGDTIIAYPGEWHWHGSAAGMAMSHLAVQFSEGDTVWNVEERDWADGYEGR